MKKLLLFMILVIGINSVYAEADYRRRRKASVYKSVRKGISHYRGVKRDINTLRGK